MIERRTVLRWMLSGAAAWPLRGVRLHAQAAALSEQSVLMLRAAAPVVLPSALGAAGHDKAVSDFVQWLASYRSGAERNWGYGAPRSNGTPTIDARNYETQLTQLDQRARAAGAAFAALPVDARRTIVTDALEAAAIRNLPGAPDGRYVISDFMGFYFNGNAAIDALYGKRIARTTCRGLSGASARPAPEGD